MKHPKSLPRLQALSDLILDQKLAVLQACAAERNATIQRLLDLTPGQPQTLGTIADAQTMLRYESWADARRAEINLILARQTAEWMEARRRAELAFGRANVLHRLGKRARP